MLWQDRPVFQLSVRKNRSQEKHYKCLEILNNIWEHYEIEVLKNFTNSFYWSVYQFFKLKYYQSEHILQKHRLWFKKKIHEIYIQIYMKYIKKYMNWFSIFITEIQATYVMPSTLCNAMHRDLQMDENTF